VWAPWAEGPCDDLPVRLDLGTVIGTPATALLHGDDAPLEAAVRKRGVEIVRDGEAHSLVTLGPPPLLRPLAEVTAEQWAERFRLWAEEPFWAFQRWLRAALDRGEGGRWIAVTTALGAQPFPGGGADGASAVALQTLVRIAAAEYGSSGVRANAIAAGWRARSLPEGLDRELALVDTPTGRLVGDDDVAAVIAWLLSDDADQVNGEILRLDGGYTIVAGSRPDPTKP
jgi:NAD(P)-dependent dehydrogenase (short-subunit alcohol dehydrogenase family)